MSEHLVFILLKNSYSFTNQLLIIPLAKLPLFKLRISSNPPTSEPRKPNSVLTHQPRWFFLRSSVHFVGGNISLRTSSFQTNLILNIPKCLTSQGNTCRGRAEEYVSRVGTRALSFVWGSLDGLISCGQFQGKLWNQWSLAFSLNLSQVLFPFHCSLISHQPHSLSLERPWIKISVVLNSQLEYKLYRHWVSSGCFIYSQKQNPHTYPPC